MSKSMGDCRAVKNDDEMWERFRASYYPDLKESELRAIHDRWVAVTSEVWPKHLRRKP